MKRAADFIRIEQQSVFLSLLLHAFVLLRLTVVFIPDPVAHKPYFVFLGSFLEPFDVNSFDPPPSDQAQDLVTVPFEPSAAPVAFRNQGGKKPVYELDRPANDKVFLKSNFLEKAAPEDREFLKSLGVDTQPAPYRHLKFKPHD